MGILLSNSPFPFYPEKVSLHSEVSFSLWGNNIPILTMLALHHKPDQLALSNPQIIAIMSHPFCPIRLPRKWPPFHILIVHGLFSFSLSGWRSPGHAKLTVYAFVQSSTNILFVTGASAVNLTVSENPYFFVATQSKLSWFNNYI